jgi:hypothetical protein
LPPDTISEKIIDKNGLFSLKKLGPTIYSVALEGQHTKIPNSIISALSLGLNFVPKLDKIDLDHLVPAFTTFRRKLRWKAFFANKPSFGNDLTFMNHILPLRLRSRLKTKPAPSHPKLDLFVSNLMISLKTKIQELPSIPLTDKKSKDIRRTWAFFKKNNNKLILKPADKGGATVLMSDFFYKLKMTEMLSNSTSCFQTIDTDPTTRLSQEVHASLLSMHNKGLINSDLYEMLKPNEKARCPSLYGLPKIHKPIIALRPIVSGNNHVTEPTSIFVDYLLQPYAIRGDFYLQDSTALLNILSEMILPSNDPNLLIFNLDVVGMYTNIPLDEASLSVNEVISENPSLLTRGKITYSRNLVNKLVKLTLHNNYFQFNNIFFLTTYVNIDSIT